MVLDTCSRFIEFPITLNLLLPETVRIILLDARNCQAVQSKKINTHPDIFICKDIRTRHGFERLNSRLQSYLFTFQLQESYSEM